MFSIIAIMGLWVLASLGYIAPEGEVSVPFTEQVITVVAPAIVLMPIANVFMYVCVALTWYSGIQYIWDAKGVLKKVLTE
jgi:phosphatidylglycerophosphate synthase